MSQLKFGTSGVRGLVTQFTDEECYRFTAAFVESIKGRRFDQMLVAGDLRESTPNIKKKVIQALNHLGYQVLDGGTVPTPALAWGCAGLRVPGIMITGSHIPADRNGLKFYLPEGEILKSDEESILKYYHQGEKNSVPSLSHSLVQAEIDLAGRFQDRYLEAFPGRPLQGLRVGFYSHSSVARDLYPPLLTQMGADVFEFGRSSHFIPVDTEAVESVQFLSQTLKEHSLHLVISTDGDADRPLVVSDAGRVVPGEILGLIASNYLGIQTIVYPVSCSSLLEASGWIEECLITRIGSPFVLGQMLDRIREFPNRRIAGFEANGGYLLGSQTMGLRPLMTRDSLLPILCFLLSMKKQSPMQASQLLTPFSNRINLSGLIRGIAPDQAALVLRNFKNQLNQGQDFDSPISLGLVGVVNELDGVRVLFQTNHIVHLRPSGNAPEFRIYIESDSLGNAEVLMDYFQDWVKRQVDSAS